MSARVDRPAAKHPPARAWWRAAVLRAALFVAAWLVLTEGSLYGPGLAALTVVAATAASLALVPPGTWRLRPLALLRFAPFFVWESVRGGVDVAVRALRPALPIRPGYLRFPTRLRTGPARGFFATCLSLLPGTVSIEMDGDSVHIHVLDTRQPVPETLRRLEEHVAALFDEDIERAGP
jgi:multicomponent Na+:H+ antiporter subunit E